MQSRQFEQIQERRPFPQVIPIVQAWHFVAELPSDALQYARFHVQEHRQTVLHHLKKP